MVSIKINKVIFINVNGKMIYKMAMDKLFIIMGIIILEIFIKELFKGKGNFKLLEKLFIMGNGKIICFMDRVNIYYI